MADATVISRFAFPDSPPILALGADLKASLCRASGGEALFAGGMGDLQDAREFARYAGTIASLEAAAGCEPALLVCDAHPGYISSGLARDAATPFVEVQHHHAHIASVMVEHGLDGPVIGVAMDGAGFGDDGAVWGGEFLLCDGASCRRVAHLEYVPLVGGDQASRDAGQAAACYLLHLGLDVPAGLHADPGLLRAAMAANVGCVASSSMGRLFDAVSALLGICAHNDSEGQCAILLQQAAEAARSAGTPPVPMAFDVIEDGDCARIGVGRIIAEAAAWRGRDAGAFALGFHAAIAALAERLLAGARLGHGAAAAAFSGGVFQNALLLELCRDAAARAGLPLFINEKVPRGDGGIALGQAYVAARRNV